MIENQVKGVDEAFTPLLTASWAHHAFVMRSDLCYRLQYGVIKLRRQNQENRIGKKRNQIILEKELESEISKNQRDGYPKGGRLIFKWTQYHCVNNICILQYEYNLSQIIGKNQIRSVSKIKRRTRL